MNDQEFVEETVAVLAVRAGRAEEEIARLRAVLQEIADWDGNGDYTNVLKRKAADALTAKEETK